jgi:hypothetical protein
MDCDKNQAILEVEKTVENKTKQKCNRWWSERKTSIELNLMQTLCHDGKPLATHRLRLVQYGIKHHSPIVRTKINNDGDAKNAPLDDSFTSGRNKP